MKKLYSLLFCSLTSIAMQAMEQGAASASTTPATVECPICFDSVHPHTDEAVSNYDVFACAGAPEAPKHLLWYHDQCMARFLHTKAGDTTCPHCRAKIRDEIVAVPPLTAAELTAIARSQGGNPLEALAERLHAYAPTPGTNPLIGATLHGDEPFIHMMLMAGADVNAQDDRGAAPLMIAITTHNERLIQLFLEHPAINVNAQGLAGINALMIAVARHDIATVTALLNRPEIHVNAGLQNGDTPLMIAVRENDPEMIRLLLTSPRINVNAAGQHFTPLMVAAIGGYTAIARMLLEHPFIAINMRDEQGDTALIHAADHNFYEIVIALLNHRNSAGTNDVDVNAQDNRGATALIRAVTNQGHFAVRLLLDVPGINLAARTDDHRTALSIAMEHNDTTSMQFLLKHPNIAFTIAEPFARMLHK